MCSARGDIITSIAGMPVSSQETLLRILGGRRPGDIVEVVGTRVGEAFSVSVELAPVPGESGGAILGIFPETKLEAVTPSQLSSAGAADPFSRPMILDGAVYLHGPLAAAWSPHTGVPPVRTALLGSDLYAVAVVDPPSLVRIGEGVTIAIDPGPTLFESPVGSIELVATGFETVLTSVGNLVLVAGGVTASDSSTAFAIHAVDPVEGSVVWSRPLAAAPSGNPLVATDGYRSPSGERALVDVGRAGSGYRRPIRGVQLLPGG